MQKQINGTDWKIKTILHVWTIDLQQRYKGNAVQKERIIFSTNGGATTA